MVFDLDMPLPFLWELEKALDEGNIEEAEAALVNYFQGSLSTIEQRLNEKFPHRAKVVSAAFSAHRREVKRSFPASKLPVRGRFRVTCMVIGSAMTTNVRRIQRYLEARIKLENSPD